MASEPITPSHGRIDLRRSQRVAAQMPVIVQGGWAEAAPFADPSYALVINAHGCLITLSRPVRLGEKLILQRAGTREKQDCRVVYLGQKQGGRIEVGLRFKIAAPQFWGLVNPPLDWKNASN